MKLFVIYITDNNATAYGGAKNAPPSLAIRIILKIVKLAFLASKDYATFLPLLAFLHGNRRFR